MVLQTLLSFFGRIVEVLLTMLGLNSSLPRLDNTINPNNSLRVYIKYSGRTIQVDLNPTWSVAQVKQSIAPLLQVNEKEIKIIFAGNELPDSFILESCDVGQQSYLHAVRVQVQHISSPITTSDADEVSTTNTTITSPSLRTRTFSHGTGEEDESITSNLSTETIHQNESTIANEASSSNSKPESSDFFVFCPECSELQEGKLRVRCATCCSGAFMVDRAPEGWDDVLIPRNISGSCEDGCNNPSAFAQFYFKCTSHVTKGEDDAAPPLNLVKRNDRDNVPCLACGDVKAVVVIYPCPLSHVTCIDCFKDYCLSKLNQREFIQDQDVGYTLGCPALCRNSLIKDPHHFKLMGKYQYDRYQRFGTEECLIQMGGVFCPQPDCGMGIIPHDNNCDKIACLHGCEYVFCRKCLEGWHIGPCRSEGEVPSENCSSTGEGSGGYRSVGYFVSEDRAAAAQWGDPTRRALRLSTKPCPNCRVPTERAGGCMHLECTKCKFEWCWVCQTKWTRDCMGNHWFG